MSEIKHEIKTHDFEKNERIKLFYERNKKVIEDLLEQAKNKLGEGMTAEVHFLDSNEEICLKILKTSRELPYHVTLEQEMEFQSLVKEIIHDFDEESKVKIPKPYLTADYTENDEEEGIKFFLMEKVKGKSIKDIIEGNGSLPEGFSIKSFRDRMIKFIDKIHKKDIYHRDLHSGNIMLDSDSGDIYVIDFGASTKSFGDEDPYRQEQFRDTKFYTTDELRLAEVCEQLKKYMSNLTNIE
jgi:serine/threonine protein kinase